MATALQNGQGVQVSRSGWLIVAAVVATLSTACGGGVGSSAAPSSGRAADTDDRLVDVGGHRLHLVCAGLGSPTVVVEMGFNTVADDWEERQAVLAESTRTCVYERAGVGRSEAGPLPRTAQRIADELADLIRAAEIESPIILVGESSGGTILQAFGQRHPAEVAGMVFVDARLAEYDSMIAEVLTVEEQSVIDRRVANLPTPYRDEVRAAIKSNRDILAGPPLPDVPVVVLTAGLHPPQQSRSDIDLWNSTHKDLVASLPHGRQRVVADAYHLMPAGPVAGAVDDVLAALRVPH